MRAVPLVLLLLLGCRAPRERLVVYADPDEDTGTMDSTWTQPDGSDDTAPDTDPPPVRPDRGPYPIVLAHGFFGFETFAGADFLTYFYGVKDALADAGETRVFTPAVDPFNSSEVRAAQLEAAVRDVLAQTGASKVNLIGHSQGGLDARIVASRHPELVASVTTIATPHGGSPAADAILGLVPVPGLQDLVDSVVQWVGPTVWDAANGQTSLFDSFTQLSTPVMDGFDARWPDGEGVAYFSIAGRSDRHDGGEACDVSAPFFVFRWRDERDPIEPLFLLTEAIVDGGLGQSIPNDGLVRVEDAKHGLFLGCIPADHMDEVGHLLGDDPGLLNDFDHLAFYVELVDWLRGRGL